MGALLNLYRTDLNCQIYPLIEQKQKYVGLRYWCRWVQCAVFRAAILIPACLIKKILSENTSDMPNVAHNSSIESRTKLLSDLITLYLPWTTSTGGFYQFQSKALFVLAHCYPKSSSELSNAWEQIPSLDFQYCLWHGECCTFIYSSSWRLIWMFIGKRHRA